MESNSDEFIELLKSHKSEIIVALLIIALIILIVGTMEILNRLKCEDNGGYWLTTKQCYIPKNDWERKQFEEKGYLNTSTGFNIEESFYLLNLSGG